GDGGIIGRRSRRRALPARGSPMSFLHLRPTTFPRSHANPTRSARLLVLSPPRSVGATGGFIHATPVSYRSLPIDTFGEYAPGAGRGRANWLRNSVAENRSVLMQRAITPR